MKRKVLILFLLLFCFSCIYAQQVDSMVVQQIQQDEKTLDTNTNEHKKIKVHSPKKAGWMSAALPGLGQGYNKKYWKIPIVYAGFTGSGIGIYYFYNQYKIYRDEYRNRLNEKTDLLDPKLASLGSDNINAIKQSYQRDMEIFIIVAVVWYFFNILDAVVDAHLMSFDISDDLSVYVAPSIGFD
ncbi:MAG: DUF5683 domain-containing protein, partial [Bacteroidales bacterium]|nr:DUF5683 domain-containing protein [Bacteroidales bacterium]